MKLKYFCVILMTIMNQITNGQSPDHFKVMDINTLNKILEDKKNSIEKEFQVDYNYAFVTTFKDGSAIIFPGNGTGEGIYFEDIKSLDKMIAERNFPVKGDGSFWEMEKDRVEKMPSSIDYYLSKLSKLLDYKVEHNYESSCLQSLSIVINENLNSKKNKKELIKYLSIFISELVRMKASAEWKLLPVYTLNVYYIPEIVKGNEFCSPWSYIINQLEMHSFIPIDLEKIIDNAMDFSPYSKRNFIEIRK